MKAQSGNMFTPNGPFHPLPGPGQGGSEQHLFSLARGPAVAVPHPAAEPFHLLSTGSLRLSSGRQTNQWTQTMVCDLWPKVIVVLLWSDWFKWVQLNWLTYLIRWGAVTLYDMLSLRFPPSYQLSRSSINDVCSELISKSGLRRTVLCYSVPLYLALNSIHHCLTYGCQSTFYYLLLHY